MQHLAGVRARGQERVAAANPGVAERRALLGPAVHLANERIDIDDQALVARAGAGRPRPRQRLSQHPVELTDVPERKRPEERAQRRRRRDLMAEDRAGPPGAQHVAVIDAVRAERHRRDQRHDLAARMRRARPLTEVDRPVHQRLDPQPRRQHGGQHHARVRDRPLIVKDDHRRVVHHAGDLLRRAATAAICRYQARLGRSPCLRTRTKRWIEAKA